MKSILFLGAILMMSISMVFFLNCSSGDDDTDSGDDTGADDDTAADDTSDDTAADDTVPDDDADDDTLAQFAYGEILGSVEASSAENVSCFGANCYVGRRGEGFVSVDVSSPVAPAIVATIDTYTAWDLALNPDGSMLAIGPDTENFIAFDVSDPSSPVETVNAAAGTKVRFVDFADGVIYGAGDDGFAAYVLEAKAASPVVTLPDYIGGLDCSGDWCYLFSADKVFAVDVSDPANPALGDDGTEFAGGSYGGFAFDGTTMYYGAYDQGAYVIDISAAPVQTQLGGKIFATDKFYDMAFAGPRTINGTDYAKVLIGADGWEGLAVIDASDPADMALIGGAPLDITVSMSDAPHGVAIMGSLAYVADNGEGRMTIVKIND